MTEDSKPYSIFYDETIDAISMQWKGYAISVEFKQGTEYMLSLLIAHKVQKVLADIEDMTLIGMEDQEWLTTDFLPRAIHHGFRAIAMIKPKYYFNKVAVESVSYKVDKEKLLINFFDDREQAEEWIRRI